VPTANPSPVGTPSRASLMQNQNITRNNFEALSPNSKKGNGSIVLVPSDAPAQQNMSFPNKFGQSTPRQSNPNPRYAYSAYHGQ
jgi:hypothetical protein